MLFAIGSSDASILCGGIVSSLKIILIQSTAIGLLKKSRRSEIRSQTKIWIFIGLK